MNTNASSYRLGAKIAIAMVATFLIAICARQALGLTQNEADFPQGYDAVTAAPGSHRVIFENALVRVLEVTMPPPGKTEPMHHHHWPGFFLTGIRAGSRPIFATTNRGILSETYRAKIVRFTRVVGRFIG